MTDQAVDPSSSDDLIDHESEAVAYDSWAIDDATDETMALSSDVSEVAIDEDSDLLGNNKKWKCCYCYKDHCYCAKHKKKEKAKDMAEDKCEDKTDKECHLDECEKD